MHGLKFLKKIDALLRGSTLAREWVNGTRLIFNSRHDEVIRDYYLYVVRLVAQAAMHVRLDADIVFGNYESWSRGGRPQFKIDFQIEHTLVKKGGRGAEHAPEGLVPVPGAAGRRYLVRVQGLDRLERADAVIEYSRPNLVNVQSSGLYPELVGRLHYIAPLVYPVEALPAVGGHRDLEIITLFGNPDEPRRRALLDILQRWNPICRNIRGRFDDIRSIYSRTKILVNIRQTDHHDTLEELRVLPALLSGVIVISEDVPLRNEVPYRDFILWAPLHKVPDLVAEVFNNYEQYWDRLFASGDLRECLANLEQENSRTAQQLLLQLRTRECRP